jgi:hypothetical protein
MEKVTGGDKEIILNRKQGLGGRVTPQTTEPTMWNTNTNWKRRM